MNEWMSPTVLLLTVTLILLLLDFYVSLLCWSLFHHFIKCLKVDSLPRFTVSLVAFSEAEMHHSVCTDVHITAQRTSVTVACFPCSFVCTCVVSVVYQRFSEVVWQRPRNDLWCIECHVKPLHYYYYYSLRMSHGRHTLLCIQLCCIVHYVMCLLSRAQPVIVARGWWCFGGRALTGWLHVLD